MDFVVPKYTLFEAAYRALAVADCDSPIPALSTICLSAKGRTLTVSASDLYRASAEQTEAEVTVPGVVTVPARPFVDILHAIPRGPVQITVTGEHVCIHPVGHLQSFWLPGGKDFPPPPSPPDAGWFMVPGAPFLLYLRAVQDCISADDARPSVNSLLWESDGDTWRFVATDGHRLGVAEAKGLPVFSALIPRDVVRALIRGYDGKRRGLPSPIQWLSGGDICVCVTATHLFIQDAQRCFSAKLVKAEFPAWRQAVPEPSELIGVPREWLLECLRAIGTIAEQGVRLTLSPGTLRIEIDSDYGVTSSPKSAASAEVAIGYRGPTISTAASVEYLRYALGRLSDYECFLSVAGSEPHPLVLSDRPLGEESVKFVIMPMRM